MILAMANLLLTHGHLVTMRGGRYGRIADGAVYVKGGTIAWVGAMADLPRSGHDDAQVLDVKGALVTPGLVDCHTHLVFAGNRAREMEMRLQGRSYAEIAKAGGGIASTMAATRAATNAQLRAATARRLEGLMEEGVTTVEIKSGYGGTVEDELRCLRIAQSLAADHAVSISTTLLGAHALPPEYKGRVDDYVDVVCTQMIPRAAKEGLASAVDGFCESIAFDAGRMRKVFEAARRHGLRVKLHADQLSDCGGAALAAEYEALSADHLEYASDQGLAALAQAGTVAVILPGAYYYLREKRPPPIESIRRHNLRMAVSTDCNPGTSPTTSLLMMANMACVLFGLGAEEALAGVTCHAAAALGMDDRGVLDHGFRADIAVWDAAQPAELVAHIGGVRPQSVLFEGRPRQ
jgi:imidazolonepropionase